MAIKNLMARIDVNSYAFDELSIDAMMEGTVIVVSGMDGSMLADVLISGNVNVQSILQELGTFAYEEITGTSISQVTIVGDMSPDVPINGQISGQFAIDLANLVSQFEKLGSAISACISTIIGDISPSVPIKASVLQGANIKGTLTGGLNVSAKMNGIIVGRGMVHSPLLKYHGNKLTYLRPDNIMSYRVMSGA